MEYSKIDTLRIKNFRNIGDVSLDFRHSPIISLVGDNESGKTSIVKAFCVASLNAYNKKQKQYIKDGTDGFSIEIDLEDGTSIQRSKTNASNILKIHKSDGTVWETSKIDTGSIPIELKNVMGMVEEPETKEFIQLRTYEDKLLFVVTPASTNYKVMYDALKVENLTKAIKLGTEEVNALRKSLDDNTTIKNHLEESLKDIKITDIEPLINIRNRLKNSVNIIGKLETALRLKEQYTILKNKGEYIEELNNIHTIETTSIEHFNRAVDLHTHINSKAYTLGLLDKIEKLSLIDTTLINKMSSLPSLLKTIHTDTSKLNKLIEIDSLSEIKELSISKLDRLEKGITLKNRSNRDCKEFSDISNIISQLEYELRSRGAKIVKCSNCGEDIVIGGFDE